MKKYTKAMLAAFTALCMLCLCVACAGNSAAPTAAPTATPSAAPSTSSSTTPEETASPEAEDPQAPAFVVTDHAGREVALQAPAQRIVSGYYISSSLCIALGLQDKLVGIEARAASRPIYNMAAPALIDLPNVGSAKEFDLEGCIALEPELVILPLRLQDAADAMTALGIQVLLVNPETQQALLEMIEMIATLTGTQARGEALVHYYAEQLAALAAFEPAHIPTVYLVGGELLRTAPKDMYQTGVIENAHGASVSADIEGNAWVDISYEQLIAYDPEMIVITSEAAVSAEDVLADKQLAKLTAVKNGDVYKMPVDFEAWDSPVPSGVLGSMWLMSVLHGDLYAFDVFQSDAVAFYETFYGVTPNASLITK